MNIYLYFQKKHKKLLVLLVLCTLSLVGFSQPKQSWADSVFHTLSIEEKIGQLFINGLNVYDQKAVVEAKQQAKSNLLGGIILSGGGAVSIQRVISQLQTTSNLPLFIGLDAETGAGEVIDSTFSFVKPLLLSATNNDSLIYETGKQIAQQLHALGVSVNFAPNASIPNKAIGDTLYHYWGEHPDQIARHVSAFVKGVQDNGILICIKNFPDISQVNNAEINIPYKELLLNNVAGILPMSSSASLSFERKVMFKKNKFLSETLLKVLTGTYMKNNYRYNGLLFINIPDVQNKNKKIRPGEAELFAFQAGNDMLIDSKNKNQAVKKIKKLVKKEVFYRNQLDSSVLKILHTKYGAGLNRKQKHNDTIQNDSLLLNNANALKKHIHQSAITVVANNDIIPFRTLDNIRFASVAIGTGYDYNFNRYLSRYTQVDEFCIPLPKDTAVFKHLADYEVVIVGVFPFSSQWNSIVTSELTKLSKKTTVVVVVFSTPDLLQHYHHYENIVMAYKPEQETTEAVAEILFGALSSKGVLPVSSGLFQIGAGSKTNSLQRLGYCFPEDVEMDSQTLEKIKDIVYEAIDAQATPGCQVLVARRGKIVYEKPFGWLTYENHTPVTNETVYDLASITKVAATLQAVCFLYEHRMIDVYKKASFYLSELKGTNKQDLTIKDILTHQAGLWPFLPFWIQTMRDSIHLPIFYNTTHSDKYPFPVSKNLYATATMKDSIWQWVVRSKMREKPLRTPYDYRYSDMGFYILQRIVETLTNQSLDDFLRQNVYEPLGAFSLGYLPLSHFKPFQIAPTEKDTTFRKSLLAGYVHDQGAAMYGGVAGHAGLFGTAQDLAKLAQVWLNKGYYGGLQYYKPETVDFFVTKQYKNSRRGLGWDKRDFVNEAISPTSRYASANTFGHTGFTGTCVWIDPDYDLIYIFLSNRVHPNMNNTKLLNLNIRTRIHDVVYESIFNYCREPLRTFNDYK